MTEHLDRERMKELEMLMGDTFGMLMETYLRDCERLLGEISDAWQSTDLQSLQQAAHTLKGASANVGAQLLAVLCAGLEAAAAQGSVDGIPTLLDELRGELREVRDALAAEQHH